MSIRGRRQLPGASFAAFVAVLVLAAVGPVPALAGVPASAQTLAPAFLHPDPIPEPRLQKPGRTPGFDLPFAPGQEIRIEQGWNTNYSHNGKAAYAYDFGLFMNTDVLAAAAGVVAFVHDGETRCGGKELLDHANYVTIYHPDGSATQYGHLSSVAVKVGDVVAAGQVIGKSGDTGYSGCMPHLHFARQYQGSGVTRSVPVYFAGYPGKEFVSGDMVAAQPAACVPPATHIAATQTDASAPADAGTSDGVASRIVTRPRDVVSGDGISAAREAQGVRAPEASTQPAAVGTAVATGVAAPIPAGAASNGNDLGSFCGAYFDGEFNGPPEFVRADALLNFDWGAKGPGGYWLDDAGQAFSAHWSGDFVFASAGNYTIGAMWSGSVVVSIDGVPVVDRLDGAATSAQAVVSQPLGAGIHRIDVQYVAASGHGMLKLGWGRLLDDE